MMKASDLTYEDKQQLLQQVKEQVGPNEYNKLVNNVGEDNLLNFVLAKSEEIASSRSNTSTKGFSGKYGLGVVVIFLLFCLAPYGVAFQIIGILMTAGLVIMWCRDKGIGFGKLIGGLFFLSIAYVFGLSFLGGADKWWQHVFALPVGLLYFWLMSR